MYVVNNVAGKNFVKDPGLHRTMLGDGIACLFASLVGGPPVTTYSEVTGAMSLTKVTDPLVFRIAAVTGVLFSLIGKVSALLRSIDQAILGGIMLLLFGTIAGAGISSLLHSRVNLASSRNVGHHLRHPHHRYRGRRALLRQLLPLGIASRLSSPSLLKPPIARAQGDREEPTNEALT